ncbi:MAG: DUF5131 family protein, partial [Robiginitomaculum sp.]|nr:DUF5131 family protein [Robiginitomaculum sp.]
YAMKMAHRICAMDPDSHYQGTVKTVNGNPVWTGKIATAQGKTLLDPLHWPSPRMVFVNSMGDLFHEGVREDWINDIFAIMALCRQHIFVILTKRPERMQDYIRTHAAGLMPWPLPNVWLGVSAENQAEADARIPILLATPATKRIVSVEPMLGPVDLRNIQFGDELFYGTKNALTGVVTCLEFPGELRPGKSLDWVICGGESGAGRRRFNPVWAEIVRDQCELAGVPFFFKQHIGRGIDDDLLDGVRHHNWPEARP